MMLLIAAGFFALCAGLLLWPLRRRSGRFPLLGVWLAMIVAGTGLYAELGAPRELGRIAYFEQANAASRARLRQRMQSVTATPDDPAAWQAFGRDLMVAGRYAEAGFAYEQARQHGGSPELLFDILTARYLAAGGTLDDAAAQSLEAAEKELPDHPRTRFFAALRQRALGQREAAATALRQLRHEVAAASPLATLIDEELARREPQ